MKQPVNLHSLLAAYADVLNRKAAEARRTEAPAARLVSTSGKAETETILR